MNEGAMNGERGEPARLRDAIREHYDLGDVGTPEPMPRAHQQRHRKLIVRASAGRFLVKTYSRDPYVLDDLRFQHRLSDHLRTNGLPVARIQRARDGRRIVEMDTWALELQEFVEGHPMRVTGDTLTQSAHALGRFHQVCHDFPRPRRNSDAWRFSEVPRRSFARLFERAKAEGDPGAVTDQCNRIALFLRDAGDALSLDQRERFEAGLIHGDWHSGNLIFHNEELKAIVDLEFAGEGCYLEDLAYAASNLCVRTTMREKRLDKRMDVLLRCYQQYRTLSYYEAVALYYAVGVKHVATVSYQIELMNGNVAGHRAPSWMERLAVQCDWLARRAREARGQY